MKPKYTIIFEPDEGGWWAISVAEVTGCHTQAKSKEQGLERIREALGLFVKNAKKAELVAEIRLPASAKREAKELAEILDQTKTLQEKSKRKMARLAKVLQDLGMSRRQSADVLDISHQRVQQILRAS